MPGSQRKSEHTQSRVVFGRNPTVHVPGLRLLTVRVKRSHKNLARIQDLQRDSNLGTFRSEPSIVASQLVPGAGERLVPMIDLPPFFFDKWGVEPCPRKPSNK
jgi:hypothetical protein